MENFLMKTNRRGWSKRDESIFSQNKYTIQVEFFPRNLQNLTNTHKLGQQVKTFIENKQS